MDAKKLEKILFEKLDYADRPGLHDTNIPWPGGRAIPNISSALFLEKTPIVYFSRLSEIDSDEIRELHKKVWSQSKAPLLFVILPHEIRVYNGYEPTPGPDEELDSEPRLLQKLTGLTESLKAERKIRTQLLEKNHYERIYLETGAFWDTTEGKKVNYENRADQKLVESMKQMRVLLKEKGLSNHLAYTLLGRSIFIRYLEDRGVLTNDWVEELTNGKVSSYLDALNSRQFTYLLFEQLSNIFNGDLFPVEESEKHVNEGHLELLLSFLNQTDLETGQLSLWSYNFEYIPIELISNIYDIFLDNRRKSGSYYTPLLLADFILEETMGDDFIRPNMTVLDPACGSGIFLVGAYRRLIQAWKRENGKPCPEVLNHILQNSIFGVDKNSEAVRIATFSLYLEILNHLSNKQVREVSFKFPSLERKNLLDCDFFDDKIDKHFADKKFDRVIGNMPWGRSTLTEKAEEWLAENDYEVGGKQAAPAFMLRAPQFCKDDGGIALLASAKSTILVTSRKHKKFRKQFFTNYHVRAIVNFSAIRKELFEDSISPAVAVFYNLNPPDPNIKLVYGVPKPSSLSRHLKSIVLDTTEIKFLDREELLTRSYLWKVALWGNPRDAALIERLVSLPTLQEQTEKLGWKEPKEGFMSEYKDSDKNKAEWLQGMPFLPANQFTPYLVKPVGVVKDKIFHRHRTKDIYRAPLTLIQHSKCKSAFLPLGSVAYTSKISGVIGNVGQENILKWLTAYINSPLARYYHFLTSTSWAVERGTVLHKEYKSMPLFIPDKDNPKFKQVLYHFDKIIELLNQDEKSWDIKSETELELKSHKTAINKLVFDLYNLHPVEQQLVKDTLEYGIEFFNWSKRKNRKPRGAKPVQRPDNSMLKTYADIFTRTVTSLLKIKNKTLNATVYENGAPLTVVSFDLVSLDEAQSVRVVKESDAMRDKLRELEELILDRKTLSIYMRRHIRIYDGNRISLVRPSERRFWTQSQARVDADAFSSELFYKENEECYIESAK